MSPSPARFSVSSSGDLASLLSTEIKQIEWVLSRLRSLYYRKDRPKPNGKKRTLWVSRDSLRPLQDKIQKEILAKVSHPSCVQGGVSKRSIITNARHHVAKPVLSTMDIKDCYPSITVERVRRVFEGLGFSGDALSILVKLTTWDYQTPARASNKPSDC